MPATALSATTVTHTTPVTMAASPGAAGDNTNGNTVPNGGSSLLIMNNTAGSSGTVTVALTTTVDGLTVTARQFTIPASTIQVVKLGPVALYGSTVTITPSASTIKFLVYAL